MQKLPQEITSYLHEHIPVTRHMGIRVLSYDGTTIRLSAPLQENINHRDSAFGGSISTLGIVVGWSYLHLRLKEEDIKNRLVIQKSRTDFIQPVLDNFESSCSIEDEKSWSKFVYTLRRRKRGRITLRPVTTSKGEKVAVHEGVFVAVVV